MTLRLRLALLASARSSVAVIVLFVALYVGVRGTLEGVLEDSLRGGVNTRLDDGRRGPNPLERGRGDGGGSRPTPPGLATVVTFTASGALVSGTPPVQVALKEGFASSEGYRVLTIRRANGGWVQAFRPGNELLSSLERVTRLFFWIAPLVALLGLVGGYLLADRALRPVAAVTRLARRIAQSGDSVERVPLAPGSDEMARLTSTINAMLDRLAGVIERERTFSLAAAHELRTPLSIIRARTSLALERDRKPAQYRAALLEVEGISLDLTVLTERLLARTSGPARVESVNLADVALEVVELHASTAEAKGVRVSLELESVPSSGDRATLLLVASNLVQNALRYGQVLGREGGRVRVATHLLEGHAVLWVEDDGPGILEADLERLLQPFQRGSKLQGSEGAGLGLALVAAVTEQHGGTLSLERSQWGGLRVRVGLPQKVLERT